MALWRCREQKPVLRTVRTPASPQGWADYLGHPSCLTQASPPPSPHVRNQPALLGEQARASVSCSRSLLLHPEPQENLALIPHPASHQFLLIRAQGPEAVTQAVDRAGFRASHLLQCFKTVPSGGAPERTWWVQILALCFLRLLLFSH